MDQQKQPIQAFDGPADTPRLPQALEEVGPTGTSSGTQTQHPVKIADPNISGHLTVWQLLKLSLVTSLLSLKKWDDINWLQLQLLLVNQTKKIPEMPKPVKSTRAVTPASSSNPYLNGLLMGKYEYRFPGHTGTTR